MHYTGAHVKPPCLFRIGISFNEPILSPRRLQRWRERGGGEHGRASPRTSKLCYACSLAGLTNSRAVRDSSISFSSCEEQPSMT